jgi:hypothetical protein
MASLRIAEQIIRFRPKHDWQIAPDCVTAVFFHYLIGQK